MSYGLLTSPPVPALRILSLESGVFIGPEPGGYARVFFQKHGERQGYRRQLSHLRLTWDEEVIAHVRPATPEALEGLWLAHRSRTASTPGELRRR